MNEYKKQPKSCAILLDYNPRLKARERLDTDSERREAPHSAESSKHKERDSRGRPQHWAVHTKERAHFPIPSYNSLLSKEKKSQKGKENLPGVPRSGVVSPSTRKGGATDRLVAKLRCVRRAKEYAGAIYRSTTELVEKRALRRRKIIIKSPRRTPPRFGKRKNCTSYFYLILYNRIPSFVLASRHLLSNCCSAICYPIAITLRVSPMRPTTDIDIKVLKTTNVLDT